MIWLHRFLWRILFLSYINRFNYKSELDKFMNFIRDIDYDYSWNYNFHTLRWHTTCVFPGSFHINLPPYGVITFVGSGTFIFLLPYHFFPCVSMVSIKSLTNWLTCEIKMNSKKWLKTQSCQEFSWSIARYCEHYTWYSYPESSGSMQSSKKMWVVHS